MRTLTGRGSRTHPKLVYKKKATDGGGGVVGGVMRRPVVEVQIPTPPTFFFNFFVLTNFAIVARKKSEIQYIAFHFDAI